MATGFLYVRSNPQKSRTPYNKSGCGFFVACRKKKNVVWYKSLDSLSAKTLLTLDLKYYEKNSLQI